MNYFLIKDSCRDGDHEYYDYVPVEIDGIFSILDHNEERN